MTGERRAATGCRTSTPGARRSASLDAAREQVRHERNHLVDGQVLARGDPSPVDAHGGRRDEGDDVVVLDAAAPRVDRALSHHPLDHGGAHAVEARLAGDRLVERPLLLGEAEERLGDGGHVARQHEVARALQILLRVLGLHLREQVLDGWIVAVEGLLVDAGALAELLDGDFSEALLEHESLEGDANRLDGLLDAQVLVAGEFHGTSFAGRGGFGNGLAR